MSCVLITVVDPVSMLTADVYDKIVGLLASAKSRENVDSHKNRAWRNSYRILRAKPLRDPLEDRREISSWVHRCPNTMFDALKSKLWEKAEDKLFDDKKKKGDDEESQKHVEVVILTDDEVLAEGRKTRMGLVFISVAMLAFCVGMMGYFAYSLTDVVGGSCDGSQDRYHNYEHCWNLKENWCAQMQCSADGQAMGTAIDPSSLDPADANVCPQGCSICGTEDGQTEKWIAQLQRFDACRERTAKVRECLPTMDYDGSLANYRGYKTAHPSSQQSAAEAFIQRDAFLDACDAQAVYADRREKGGTAVVACIAVCALVWLAMTAYLMRTPNYEKHPRETEMPDLAKWQDRKDYTHRFHPRSAWLYYNTANNLFGFALQLYSFYTPTSTNILVPIFQGAWMTVMVVARGILVFMDYYTLSEAASVFFDIGFSVIGFTAILDPFFEAKITTDLPEADTSITDYALAVRVAAFLWPVISSAGGIKDLYCDVYWPSPATLKAIKDKQKSFQKRAVKISIFVIQLLAALSVYVIMANPRWCHDFRTCQRKTTCDPLEGALLSRMPMDTEVISGNKMQRVEMISDDGTKKWRWQINTQTVLSFTKSGGKVYADIEFAIPNGDVENKVTTPGTNDADNIAGTTPSSACSTRFEIQCHESNPRHAFKSQTGAWDWVAYNSSMYKFVARHDGGEASGESTCFGANTAWWNDNGMFTAGPDLKIGDGDGEDKVGFIFMEQTCDSSDSDLPRGCSNGPDSDTPCRTDNCLVEPSYIASYAPYGRASVTGTWTYTGGDSAPDTWATTQRVFELDVSELRLSTASEQSDGSPPPGAPGSPGAGCGPGEGQTPCDGGEAGAGDNNAGSNGGNNGDQQQCVAKPTGCASAPCPGVCSEGTLPPCCV